MDFEQCTVNSVKKEHKPGVWESSFDVLLENFCFFQRRYGLSLFHGKKMIHGCMRSELAVLDFASS